MNASTLVLELRRSRVLLFWLALTSVLFAGFMAAYYPTFIADTEMVETMLERFPREMVAAFGMEGNLADQGTYFNVYVLSLVWPLPAAIAAILIPTRTFSADVERGFLELAVTTPVSRTRYLLAAIAAQLVVVVAFVGATVAAMVGGLLLRGVAVDLAAYAMLGALGVSFASAIAAATTLLSVLTLSRAMAGGIVAGALLLANVANTVAKLSPELDWVAYLSAFHYFAPAPVIDSGVLPVDGLVVFGLASFAAWTASLWAFPRRDLLA